MTADVDEEGLLVAVADVLFQRGAVGDVRVEFVFEAAELLNEGFSDFPLADNRSLRRSREPIGVYGGSHCDIVMGFPGGLLCD